MRYELLLAGAMLAASCTAAPPATPATPPFNPNDPSVAATIDSIVTAARTGADAADPERAASALNADENLTFLTGDVLLAGHENIRNAFRQTYKQIRGQRTIPVARQVRLLSPDVALFVGTARGTFMDLEGKISDPVGLGTTAIFVRRDGKWHLAHYHQSIAR